MDVQQRQLQFVVDFSQHRDGPLVKDKFGVYQTPFLTSAQLLQCAPLLREAGVRDLRYEMAWGKPDAYAADQARIPPDFSALDPFLRMLGDEGIRPLLSVGYCPDDLKSRTVWDAWKDLPADLTRWGEINRAYAFHYRNVLNLEGASYEIWNEPDLALGGEKVFFTGGPDEYGKLYGAAARDLKTGDPDCLVGGPAAAWQMEYFHALAASGKPVDFASIHAYANYPAQIGLMRAAINQIPDERLRNTIPVYLTEYASYTTFPRNGPQNRFPGAERFFQDVSGMLDYTDTTKVYWAQWADDDLGLLTFKLRRKAIFNAYKIYQSMLPVDRVTVEPESASGVHTLAATDARCAGVVLWNDGDQDRLLSINLRAFPFPRGTLHLFRIDANHASYFDNPDSENLSVVDSWPIRDRSAVWDGMIPAHAVVFLQALATGTAGPEAAKPMSSERAPGEYIRTNYHFEDRASDSYANFDPATWIVRLGTGSKDAGAAQIGVVVKHPAREMRVQSKCDGSFTPAGPGALFGIRVEWAGEGETPSRSVLFYAPVDGSRQTGNGLPDLQNFRAEKELATPALLTGRSFVIHLARLAPVGWNGERVTLTFLLRNMKKETRARITLEAKPKRS